VRGAASGVLARRVATVLGPPAKLDAASPARVGRWRAYRRQGRWRLGAPSTHPPWAGPFTCTIGARNTLARGVLDRLTAMRGPGDGYSDAIVRVARGYATRGPGFPNPETTAARADFLVADAVLRNRSRSGEFPGNREKNRELVRKSDQRVSSASKFICWDKRLRQNSLRNRTGN
jgi:hypothetical protein